MNNDKSERLDFILCEFAVFALSAVDSVWLALKVVVLCLVILWPSFYFVLGEWVRMDLWRAYDMFTDFWSLLSFFFLPFIHSYRCLNSDDNNRQVSK